MAVVPNIKPVIAAARIEVFFMGDFLCRVVLG
jgi:hypothetical protein